MEPVQLAAILGSAALVASMVSVEIGISVALLELALGVALGNVFNLDPDASWLAFLASFASVVLTFLAGAEVDPDDFRERFGASIAIGVVSFAGPFAAASTCRSARCSRTSARSPCSRSRRWSPSSGSCTRLRAATRARMPPSRRC